MPNSSDTFAPLERFWFVRHGETESNVRGLRCGGDVDIPLTAHGEQQIRALAPQIGALGIDLIVSSALQRTQRSALILSGMLGGIAILTEPLFNERRLGAWNGRPHQEAEHLLRSGMTPPGGEAEDQFRQRILQGVAGLREKIPHSILVVSSKGVARILSATFGHATPRHAANGELLLYELARAVHGTSPCGMTPI